MKMSDHKDGSAVQHNMAAQPGSAVQHAVQTLRWVSQLCFLLQGSCCQVKFAAQTFTEAGQLHAALQKRLQPSSEPQLYAFDHIYSSDPQTSFKIWHADNASAAVLYGTPGTTCFQDLHKLLKDAVTRQYTEGLLCLQSLYNHKEPSALKCSSALHAVL